MKQSRVALITGAGRGIGRSIALSLARVGIDVAVNYRFDSEAATETVQDIIGLGRRAQAYQASVGDADACGELARRVLEDFGSVHILVHNAGNASRGHTVVDTDPAELQKLMCVHAFGPHHLCQALIPSLRQHGRSDIVFISSTATEYQPAGGAPYNMAKSAMESLALSIAKEERPNGIRVNIVAPGLVATEMGRRLVKARDGLDEIDDLAPTMPFGRVCSPQDVADAVTWVVSDRASYITGQRIRVDGGGEW